MPVQSTQEDILPHVKAATAPAMAGKAKAMTLEESVGAISGCFNVVSFAGCTLKVCYSVAVDLIKLTVELDTPLGTIQLGSATLDPQNPSVTISGGAFGFKAEVTISFNFSTMVLSIQYKVCAPIVGCKSGSFEIHL